MHRRIGHAGICILLHHVEDLGMDSAQFEVVMFGGDFFFILVGNETGICVHMYCCLCFL